MKIKNMLKCLLLMGLLILFIPTIKADAATVGWKKTTKGYQWVKKDGNFAKSEWVQSKGKWYFINRNGVRHKGWLTVSGKTYYLGTDYSKVSDWQLIKDNWYFFDKDGVLRRNTYVDCWTTNSKGAIPKEDYMELMVDEDGVRYYMVWYDSKSKVDKISGNYPFKKDGYIQAGFMGIESWSDRWEFILDYDTKLADVKIIRSGVSTDYMILIKPKKVGNCKLKITARHPGTVDYIYNTRIEIVKSTDGSYADSHNVNNDKIATFYGKNRGSQFYVNAYDKAKSNSRLKAFEKLLIFEYGCYVEMYSVNNTLIDINKGDTKEETIIFNTITDKYIDNNIVKLLDKRAQYLYDVGGMDDHFGYNKVMLGVDRDGEILCSFESYLSIKEAIISWKNSPLHNFYLSHSISKCATPLVVKTGNTMVYSLIYSSPEKEPTNIYERYNFVYSK